MSTKIGPDYLLRTPGIASRHARSFDISPRTVPSLPVWKKIVRVLVASVCIARCNRGSILTSAITLRLPSFYNNHWIRHSAAARSPMLSLFFCSRSQRFRDEERETKNIFSFSDLLNAGSLAHRIVIMLVVLTGEVLRSYNHEQKRRNEKPRFS